MSSPVLSIQNISKAFGGFLALNDVSIDLFPGEIHAVLGENGAGKSTLLNILAGITQPTSGELQLNGTSVVFASAVDAAKAGIGMVHQHFMLVSTLSSTENLLLADMVENRAWFSWPAGPVRDRIAAQAKSFGWEVDLDARIDTQTVGAQQRLEILKALQGERKVLLLDEPTAVLTPGELPGFFATIRNIAASGTAVVIITHKLDEVIAVSDRVTVLRRGQVVHECQTAETNVDDLAREMVGDNSTAFAILTEASGSPGTPHQHEERVVLKDAGSVAGDSVLKHGNVAVRAGEIFGVAGVDGNGQGALAALLTGNTPLTSGELSICGEVMTPQQRLSPQTFLADGVSYIPADRQADGLVMTMSIADNIVLDRIGDAPFTRYGVFIDRKAIRHFAQSEIERFDIRPTDQSRIVSSLSGGNQQKVVIARALSRNPRVLVAVNPTRGLDVGAIAYVHRALREATADGCAVVLISTELDEILALSDRIAVLFEGCLSETLPGGVSKAELGRLMGGAAL
jgi:simple sugar transport system ATP-binding protein